MARNTSCIAGAWPRISGASRGAISTLASRRLSSRARRISATALSMSKGLARYSKAPPWKEATAESRSENAVITMTGRPGCFSLTAASRSRPDSPGMRMSETSTCGLSSSNAASASRPLAKLRVARFSRARAFSSTQRIDASSSTIQIGFMYFSASREDIIIGPRPHCARCLWQRDQDAEIRQSRPAFALDQTQVLLHEGLRQRQPEAAAAFAPGDERIEDAVADLGAMPGPLSMICKSNASP
jgi:hypothetical protein